MTDPKCNHDWQPALMYYGAAWCRKCNYYSFELSDPGVGAEVAQLKERVRKLEQALHQGDHHDCDY